MNLELHQSGLLDCLGQMWTWVSGVGADSTGLVGTWSNVIDAKTGLWLHAYAGQQLEAKTGSTIEVRNA